MDLVFQISKDDIFLPNDIKISFVEYEAFLIIAIIFIYRGSACSSEMIVQKKKSAREIQVDSSQIGYQSKNVLAPGSSNESLGNPVQTIGKGFNK